MLLKKQTVWLLTMLSLVIVLSVYYITSPTQQATDMAAAESDSSNQVNNEETNKETLTESEGKVDVVTETAGDQMFEALRLEINDKRSKLREELEAKVANADTTEEKNMAYEQLENLKEAEMTETVLETMIKTQGYDDTLVRIVDGKVNITVKAKEHSPEAANEIIRLVTDEIGQYKPVAVTFQPVK